MAFKRRHNRRTDINFQPVSRHRQSHREICFFPVITSGLFFSYPGADGEQKEVQVSKQDAKLVIRDFDPLKEYNFKIFAVSGQQQSKPLQGKHEGKRLSPLSNMTLI